MLCFTIFADCSDESKYKINITNPEYVALEWTETVSSNRNPIGVNEEQERREEKL
jgi:hypothetical protein